MNITINKTDSTTFEARYLKILNADKMPKKITEAIYKNSSIDKFIKDGKPKTLWDKLIDLFKKDEVLEVSYTESAYLFPNRVMPKVLLNDPYTKTCNLSFNFHKRNGFIKQLSLTSLQVGIERQSGSIPKKGEHYAYKPPLITAETKLIKEIDGIKDFESLML